MALPLALLAAVACTPGGGNGGAGGGNNPGTNGGGGGTPIDADLVADSAAAGATVLEAGESLPVTFSVRNAGPATVGFFRVTAFLSTDTTLDAADTPLFTWSSVGLVAGASFSSAGDAQVPVTTTPGTYRLLVMVDDDHRYAELDETNNIAVASALIEVQLPTHPDLVMESVSFGPATIQAGGTIEVTHVLRNAGVEGSGAFRAGVYVSTDPTITADDFLVGQRQIPALPVGATDMASGTVTIPTLVPAGSYYVGVLADDLGVIVEMDETNNGLAAPAVLTVTAAPLPDLVPTAFSTTATMLDAGQPFTVTDTVLNQGSSGAQLFQIGVYLSTDNDIDPDDDILVGTRSVASLAAGALDASGPWACTVPGSTPGGTYFVGVAVDSTEFVPESNEGNNVLAASGSLTVTVPPLPDLVLDTFTTPGPSSVTADGSGTLSVQYSARNQGAASSPAATATVYLSPDASVTPSDIPLGSFTLPALDVGTGAGQTLSLPVPGGIASGSYRVGLYLDPENLIAELNEGNNLIVEPGLLDVIGGGPAEPNLVAELIDPALSLAAPGASFQVVTRVANRGDISTPAFRVVVVLSVDAEIEPTDTVIASRLVPFGLGGGFSSVASAPVTIPISMPDGIYRIGVFADADDVVLESDETDNGLADTAPFEVRTPPPPRPNLVVTSATYPVAMAAPGAVLDVANEVRNSGDVDASSFRVGIYLSSDEVIETTDTLLATRVVSALAQGATSSAATAVQIPASTGSGTWYVGVIVDDTNSVAESNENDNTLRAPGSFDI